MTDLEKIKKEAKSEVGFSDDTFMPITYIEIEKWIDQAYVAGILSERKRILEGLPEGRKPDDGYGDEAACNWGFNECLQLVKDLINK